jgi:hypothetical protein
MGFESDILEQSTTINDACEDVGTRRDEPLERSIGITRNDVRSNRFVSRRRQDQLSNSHTLAGHQ